ncbi:hypothetical protein [Embleya sp. NBC_00896]|uniref:hypothetical protein n=1 Tax=Embleya sp. NBC_00896 TaxID=2975961 RepID=UPI00386845A5|nr:hypothetical protein OG928_16495 [Embleya sp. NBC_00896]
MNAKSEFQEQLLTELQAVVAERAAAPVPPTRRSARRIGALVAVVAAAAVSAVVVPTFFDGTATPAYAAERDDDGTIKIRVREFTDSSGLQGRLRDLGVNAVVDFVPVDRQCAEPRADFAPYDPLLLTSEAPTEETEGYLRLHPDRIAPGKALVLEVYYRNDTGGHVSSDRARIATGPVAPCRLLPGKVVVGPGN